MTALFWFRIKQRLNQKRLIPSIRIRRKQWQSMAYRKTESRRSSFFRMIRKSSGEITKENHREYIAETCKRAKASLDRAGITFDNVDEISDYAGARYLAGRYDETEADMMAYRKDKIR